MYSHGADFPPLSEVWLSCTLSTAMASSTLTACFIWFFVSMFLVTSCPIFDNCLQKLEDLHSNITSGSADIVKPCIQVLQSNLPCFTAAVTQCQSSLEISDIINFQNVRGTVQTSCKDYCPIIEDVKSCTDNIDHNALGRSKKEFCRSYTSSFQCYQDKLDIKKCPIGSQLFSKLVDEDTLRLGRYICDTDCSDIDAATIALESCSNIVDKSDTSCNTYKEVQLCIEDAMLCPEARKMMPYYLPAFKTMEEKCAPQPTTTSTSTKGSTTTIRPRDTTAKEMAIDSLIGNCTRGLQSSSDVCKTVHCMKDKNIMKVDIRQELLAKEPLLQNVIKEWDMCSRTTETASIEKQTAVKGSTSQSKTTSTEPLTESTFTYHQPSSSLDVSTSGLSTRTEPESASSLASPTEAESTTGLTSPTTAGSTSGLTSTTIAESTTGLTSPTTAGSTSGLTSPTKAESTTGLTSPITAGSTSGLTSPTKARSTSGLTSPTKAGSTSGLPPPTKAGSISGLPLPTKAGSASDPTSPAEPTTSDLAFEFSSIKDKKSLITTYTTQRLNKDGLFSGTSEKFETVSDGKVYTVKKTEESNRALPFIPNFTSIVKLSTVGGLPSSKHRQSSTETIAAKSQTIQDGVTSPLSTGLPTKINTMLQTSSVAQPKHTGNLSTVPTHTNTFSNTNIGHTSPESDGSTINSLASITTKRSKSTTQVRRENDTPDKDTGQQMDGNNGCGDNKFSSLQTIILLLFLVILW